MKPSLTTPATPRHAQRTMFGFTLIELLVVLAIMATLLSIVGPRYFDSVDKAKEAALKTNLRIVRDAIDKHKADTGQYPESLSKLVEGRYIYALPMDPVTERVDTWTIVPHPGGMVPGIYDIHSSAEGRGKDGSPFKQW